MGRHNREGRGEDQRGRTYTVAYPPDWLRQVKVTCGLRTGRQSTKTLLRNADLPAQEPGPRTRTRVRSEELGIDFEVALEDARGVVRRVIVETVVPGGSDAGETIVFSICRTLDDAPADD